MVPSAIARHDQRSMKIVFRLLALLFCLGGVSLRAGTFSIESIHVHAQTAGLTAGIQGDDPRPTAGRPAKVFVPQVEVAIKVDRDALSTNLMAKAYFFDDEGRPLQSFSEPSAALRPAGAAESVRGSGSTTVWPTLLPANSQQSIYFPLPADLPATWSLVIVFGNANGAVAASVPDGEEDKLDYPERDLVAKTLLSPDVAIADSDEAAPLIEQVVKSDNPAYPAFTLLLHLPHGVKNPRDVKGVLATCMLANSVGEIRNQLNAIKPENDPNAYFAFAESHQMAVLAWGARWVWSSSANFDELGQGETRTWDDSFQQLADAWDRGVQALVDQDGLPDRDYLMYGLCVGGEWAHRLALHKPERFLAVQMHISTSYDAPTPEASGIMWLLTTGELDSGCDRARRFYAAARALQYPIVFKAVVGQGHGDSAVADELGVRFFQYALDTKSRRDAARASGTPAGLDFSSFSASPFYGDLMNQEMFAREDRDKIPGEFLVPLPTREIAAAWKQ
jgi:hypothetical protein